MTIKAIPTKVCEIMQPDNREANYTEGDSRGLAIPTKLR